MEFIMRHAAALAALALLAACSDASERTITDSESGESVTLRTADDPDAGIAPPANLPAFAPIYPGAVVTTSVTGNPDEQKGMVAFTTSDSEDAVIAFYRDKAKAAGLAEQAEMNMSGTRILSMGSGNTGDAGLQVTVSPLDDEDRRMVQIVYVTQ
jgi:ABC-type glycerol-3-phosphate transport system substrate-binding protein